jgi:four helix bundle protein
MNNHKDLEVWRKSVALAKDVYEATGDFPKDEVFGLTSQMKRAAVSIASNIAEGAARKGQQEFVQFLYIAIGSASELDTQIEIAKAIGIGNTDTLNQLQNSTDTVKAMLYGLAKSIKARQAAEK